MILYVMRHGIALDQTEWNGAESERPLTEEGIERTRQVARKFASLADAAVDAIWSSPFKRAFQTAELAGEALGVAVKVVDQLECGANVASLMRLAKSTPLPARLMTVGHEPDCGEIVSELIGHAAGTHAFKRAGIAKLSGEFKPGGMKLIWQRAPKELLEE